MPSLILRTAWLSSGFALVALAACGTPASRAVPAKPTIVFGAPIALTGRLAREGRLTQEGYDFWKDYVNSRGGLKVGGTRYHVAIRYYDDATSPQQSARLAQTLIDRDRVDFLLGPYGSVNSLAVAAVAERNKTPLVEGNGSAERIFEQGYRYTFGVESPARRYLVGVIDMAAHQRHAPRSMAITAADDMFSVEVQQGAIDAAQRHGIRVLYSARYPVATTDVSGVVSAIKATKPEMILNAGHLQDALLIHRGLREQNVNARVYGYSVGPDTPDFRESLGRFAEGVYGGSQWSPTAPYRGAPGFYETSAEYGAAFARRYGHDPDYHNANATAACLAFQYALSAAGTLDRAAVRNALQSLRVMTFYGPLRFDARGLNALKPMATNQVQDGRLVTVWPPSFASAHPRYPATTWQRQ